MKTDSTSGVPVWTNNVEILAQEVSTVLSKIYSMIFIVYYFV